MDFIKFIKNNKLDLSRIKYLDAKGIKEMATFVGENPNITSLSLSGCFWYGATDIAKSSLVANHKPSAFEFLMENTPQILTQKLAFNQLVESIKEGQLKHITNFDFSENNINAICLVIDQITKHAPNLEVLNLKNTGITTRDLFNMSKSGLFKQFSNIKHLDLSYNNMDDEGIKYLLQNLPAPINIEKEKSTPEDIAKYESLTEEEMANYNENYILFNYFNKLEELNLSHNNLDDKAAHKLAKKLPSITELKVLDLDGNHITRSGLAELSQAINLHNPNCYNLSVANNPEITEQDLITVNHILTSDQYSKEGFDKYIQISGEHTKNLQYITKISSDMSKISQNSEVPEPINELVSSIQNLHIQSAFVTRGAQKEMEDNLINNPTTDNSLTLNNAMTLIGQNKSQNDYDSEDDDEGCTIM